MDPSQFNELLNVIQTVALAIIAAYQRSLSQSKGAEKSAQSNGREPRP